MTKYDRKVKEYGNHVNQAIVRIITSMGPGKKVLDIGCSAGALGSELKKRGNEVWGIDISEKAIFSPTRSIANSTAVNGIASSWRERYLPVRGFTFRILPPK